MASDDENRPHGLERLASVAHYITFSKLCSAVSYGAAANIYKPVTIVAMELSSQQCLLLALLNSLVTGDIMSCLLLASVCQQVPQLRSKYLKVWLTEDFIFPRQDMEKAIALLAELVSTGVMKLPSHVTCIMSSLAIKYGIAIPQITSPTEVGAGDLVIEMENAVSNNSPDDIITLFTAGGDINRFTRSGESLLHLAVRTGKSASIAVLGILKADMEMVNSSMATPLEVAVMNNDVHSIAALLMAGANINKQLFGGNSYLHIAASGGQNRALSALLERGLDANVKNHHYETPLYLAVRAGNVLGVDILLENGADLSIVPEGSKTLVEIAVESENIELFKIFMKSKTLSTFSTKCRGDSLVHLVANSGNVEMFKILKDRGLSAYTKNIFSRTPLHVASDLTIVRMLLGMGLDVDSKDKIGCTALMFAAKNSKPEIATFLLYNGANPKLKDREGMTTLHHAAAGGNVEIVKAVLEAGAKIEEKDNEGKTPAFIAAVNNKLNALKLLVEHGAKLTLVDKNGEGMIHHAARNGYSDIISVLLSSGVMVDMKSTGYRTALHYAAEKGHVSVVSVLLSHGADITAMTDIYYNNRWTPLIASSKVGCLDVAKLLVDKGAPVNDRDSLKNWTALGWALNNEHKAVADYLRSVGGTE